MQAGARRKLETGLAWFTLGCLLSYVPGETAYSWPRLLHPGYLVDVIAFVLLAFGAWHSLRRRPLPAVGPLCAAWGYCACLGWRCHFMRVVSRKEELGIYGSEHPAAEAIIGAATVIAFGCLAISLYLATAGSTVRGGAATTFDSGPADSQAPSPRSRKV